MIQLLDNTYKRDLLHWVYTLNVGECDLVELELLKKVCTCYLFNHSHDFQIDRIQINETEKRLIKERDFIHAANKEIRARFLDIAIRSGMYPSQKLEMKRQCSDLYLELSAEQHECSSFIRSIMVRDVHSLWDDVYASNIMSVIEQESFNPKWIETVAPKLRQNLGANSTTIKSVLSLYTRWKETEHQEDFIWQLQYIDFLLAFEHISNEDAHLRKALVHEAQGDHMTASKAQNTFYPNLHQTYQDAFNEINKIRNQYPEEWQRIHEKLVASKKEFVDMLSIVGVRTKFEVDESFQNYIRNEVLTKLEYSDARDVLLFLMNVPHYPADDQLVNSIRQKQSTQSPLLACCFNMAQVNREGNVVGQTKNDAGFNVQTHRFLRIHMLYHLWTITEHFQAMRLCLKEDDVYTLLYSKNSKLINESNLILWTKAICSIMNGEALLGTYILMPQVEAILRAMAEEVIGDQTKLTQEKQEESTLGGVLNSLRPLMSETLNDELQLFLIDGCDENLRNRMLHGLIESPMIVQRNSIYLLYIALNLFFREKKFILKRIQDDRDNRNIFG